jgi:tetratricopeptide (TPR) repeat protein
MEIFDLRIAKALALSREDELLYEGIVKTSATNAGSWNNLGVARTFSANALWEAGRLAECRDKIRAAIEVGERMPKIGSFQARNLAYWSGWVAEVEADLGNPTAAAAALAESESVWQRYVKPTAGPFNMALDANWLEVTRTWVLLGNGEWPKAASHAAAVLERIDDLKPNTKAEEDEKRRQRLRSNLAVAVAELERGNPAASEAATRMVLADWKPLPRRGFLGTERDLANFETLLAEAVARQGRTSEAREILRSSLKYHRDRYARRHDAPMQHFELARAIHVSALAEPDRRGVLLAEASAIFDSLPPTMSQWQTAVRLRKSIAESARLKP